MSRTVWNLHKYDLFNDRQYAIIFWTFFLTEFTKQLYLLLLVRLQSTLANLDTRAHVYEDDVIDSDDDLDCDSWIECEGKPRARIENAEETSTDKETRKNYYIF